MTRLALAAIALIAVAAGLAQLSEAGGTTRTAAGSVTVEAGDAEFGTVAMSSTIPPATLPAPPPSVPPDIAASPPRVVRVPAIEVDATIIDLGLETDGSLETPRDYALAGWWAGGTTANQPGPTVIVGHVDDYTGPAVFFRLRELSAGDVIEVVDSTGLATSFVVTETALYDKDDFPTERVYGPTDGPTLRLITCGGDFDSSERSYEANVVVYAELR